MFHIVGSDISSTTIHRPHCCASLTKLSVFITLLTATYVAQHYEIKHSCVSTATTVTRTRHNITLHVYCLSCFGMSSSNHKQTHSFTLTRWRHLRQYAAHIDTVSTHKQITRDALLRLSSIRYKRSGYIVTAPSCTGYNWLHHDYTSAYSSGHIQNKRMEEKKGVY